MDNTNKILCYECGKKIPKLFIQMYTCRCTKKYCSQHINGHCCTFDHRTNLKSMPKISGIKIEPI